MKNFGFIPSLITDKTPKFNAPKTMSLPVKFSYVKSLSPVGNQGTNPYCIPYSISAWLNWKMGSKTGVYVDNHIKYEDIYKSKTTQGEGMTYTDAFKYLEKNGVKTDKGVVKITSAGFIANVSWLKAALLANGPCFGALPVYNTESQTFWKKTGTLQGWHSVAIVGWNETGYIIRNSWGTSFANGGYVVLPYSDVSNFREIWTILG